MKKTITFFRLLPVILLALLLTGSGVKAWGQVTIALQDFETTPATPTWSYSTTGGATNSTANKYVGTQSFRLAASNIITFDNVDISGYSSIVLSVNFASVGADTDEDLFMDISYDNGSTWDATGSIKLIDGYSNANININSTNASNPTTVSSNPWLTNISSTQIRVRFRAVALDTDEYFFIDNVKLTGTPAGNTSPSLSTPTAASITTSTATLGASITYNGGEDPTASGIVYGTSATPTGNATATSPNVASGAFTVPVSSLLPETQYYYRGYATNSFGTGYSADGTFRTLSNAPTAQATALSGVATSNTALTVSWAAASFPASGATAKGYVLLRATSPNTPSLSNGNGATPTAGTNTTIVSSTIAEAATSQASSGLTANTTYNYLLVPYCWDGTNAATYNYLTTSAPTATATTFSSASGVTISNRTANSMDLSWTNGNGSGRIVVARLSTTNRVAPTTGTVYTANTASFTDVSNSATGTGNVVVYNGTGNNVEVTGLTANTNYIFDIYEYNGTTGTINYSTVLSSSATSTLSAEPTTQASSITYSNITATSMTIGFTAGNGAGRIILLKQGNAVDAIPIDGTSYTGNLAFGSGNQIGTGNFVVRASTATGTATITNLNPNTTYHIAIFEYNGTSGTINYLTSSALIGSATTRPTPASNVSVTSRTVNSIGINWTNGNGTGRIVVARTPSAISPTDGVEYTYSSTDITDVLNSITGTGNFVVYNGTGNNVNITGLSASTNYKFDVYEYNGSGAERIYALAGTSATNIFTLNTEPTTAASIIGFSNINATGLTINMEKGDGANRLIIAKANSAVNANPVDGESYNAAAFGSGTQIGTGNYVVYSGAAANATITGLNANTTYHFAVYEFNGSGTTINYLTTNTPNANQITLVSAPTTPTNLSFSTVTQSSFNISFTASSGSPTGYLVMRRMGAALTGSPVGGTVYEAGQSIGAAANQIIYVGTDALSNFAQTSLVDNTTYHYAVYAYSGSGSQTNYSLALSGSQTTLTAAVTLPYTQNFESTTNEWLLATTGTNKWAIGSATNNGGTKALYISNDGGATNAYTLNSAQTGTDAVVRIDLTGQTAASLSFDWKSNGEVGGSGTVFDYGEVYINTGSSDIRLSAAKEFVNTTTFAIKNISLTPYVGGVVSLKFRWVNDGSSGNQPPFAIDNISITAGDYPSLTTTTTTSITTNGVTTGGNITNDGGSAISARGVCYGTSPNPTIAGDKTSDGTGTGSFVSTISGLIDNTIYYVRAYATNSTSTSYGNEISFTTASVSAPVATAATGISTTGFTANWEAVTGALGYKLDISTVSNFGYTSKLSENFSGFTTNNGSVDRSTTLNTYLQTTGWTGDAIYEMIGYTKMGSGSTKGILTTPKIDLSANSGNATLTFDLMKYGTDGTVVQVFHAPDGTTFSQVGSDINPPASLTTQTINITGGTVNSKIRIASKSLSDYRFYLDNFNIAQENPSALLSSYNNLSVSGSSQGVTGLSPNNTYYYRVRANSANSIAANSNVVSVLTHPAAPVAEAASTVNALNFVANWTLPGTGADSYTLDVATDEGFNNKLEAYNNLTVTGTSQAISGLSRNTTYYYRVKSVNASGVSVSNVISVSTENAITVTGSNESAESLADCDDCDLVVNQGGHLTVNANKKFNSVTIKPGAKLTLNNGQTFAPGTFVLESNASATATFVDKRTHANKTNITATVQQHLPAASTRTWWYLASPVSGAASTVFGSNKVGDYSEADRSYSSPFAAPTTLIAGKGYVVKMTSTEAANYVFENKTLNTGDISVTLTRTVTETPDNAKRGFNLVGNPYPSYLNWELAYNNSTNVRSTIWYRTLNGASMEFHTYNATLNASVPSSASGYIPPMQAFWVKVDKDPTEGSVSNGTLNFTNDMRSHDLSALGNPLKTPTADRNLVRLSISNGTLSDETVIVTHPSASDNYDSYDSEKMANGDTNRPEIFSMAGNQELVINGISPLTDSKQIALGVRPGRAGNYTISLTEWRNTGNLEAVLRDNQLGEELILTESNNYSFDTDGSTSTSRFSLLFRAKGSNTGFDRISSDLLIYASQKSIRVESESLEGNNVSVHNALGQLVFSGKAQSNRLEINGLTPAVYMVKVNNQTKMVIVK